MYIKYNQLMTMDSGRRNQHLSSLYLYTVVALIGITVCSLSVHEGKYVKIKKYFSYSITCEHIVNIQGVSVEQCVDECMSRMICESVNYIERYKYCELCANNDTSGTTRTKDSLYINRHEIEQENVTHSCNCSANQSCRNNGGTPQCQIEECGEPPSLGDRTRILGNRRQTGSTIKYYCEVPLTGHRYNFVQSVCQDNGEWTVPNTTCEDETYQGCYVDVEPRVLIHTTVIDLDNMTWEICNTHCSTYTYFGVEFYSVCMCGNQLPSSDRLANDNECNMTCHGNPEQICGGNWRISIYNTSA